MMMRSTTLVLAGAVLCASFAFADGSKNAELQVAAPGQMVLPKRMMKVRWENGRIVPATPWIELGDFAPAGPCDPNEVLVFDHFGTDANGNPIDGANCRPDFAPSTRWYFGPTYHNPYWANDIETLVDAQYNGATAFLDGVVLDYGTLSPGTGYYYSPVCLSAIGGIQLPATPADDGDPGTVLLGGWAVIYAQAFDPNTGAVTYATRAQPMLWSTQDAGNIGSSTELQWDDDSPTDYDHDPAVECFDYTFNVCADPPRKLGGMMAFWVTPSCQPHDGDVDENGCVDDADLLAVLFAFGNSGSNLGRVDVNCDQVVDDADLLAVLFAFGNGC
jgi:hypothetical protein